MVAVAVVFPYVSANLAQNPGDPEHCGTAGRRGGHQTEVIVRSSVFGSSTQGRRRPAAPDAGYRLGKREIENQIGSQEDWQIDRRSFMPSLGGGHVFLLPAGNL